MGKTLVAFFSHAGENYVSGSIKVLERGNAAVLADFAAEATGGDLFEIRPARDYPANYRQCTDAAKAELEANDRPALAGELPDVALYDTVVLLYPNWWGTMPMPVYTFLEGLDFSGKVILPLCTHEGSGLSRTEADVARACPGADVRPGLAVVGSQAATAQREVTAWIERELGRA